MNIWSKSFIVIILMASFAIRGAEHKKEAAQKAVQEELNKTLSQAVLSKPSKKVEALLLKKANPNYGTRFSPLADAVGLRSVKKVKLLLCHGADATNQESDYNPLAITIDRLKDHRLYNENMKADLIHIITLLIGHGADANRYNRSLGCSTFEKCVINDYAETSCIIQKILNEQAAKVIEKIADACPTFSMDIVKLCTGNLYVTDQELKERRAKSFAHAIPQLAQAPDASGKETDLTPCIAEYV